MVKIPDRYQPTRTVTNKMFKDKLRSFTSDSLKGKMPLDKQQLTMELVLVERFYPTKMAARVTFRDTVNNEDVKTVTVKIGMPFPIDPSFEISVIPDGTHEICPDEGWPSIVPNDTYVGGVMAINGDPAANGNVLMFYVHMLGEPDKEYVPDQLTLRYGNSKITISTDEIRIDTPNLYINGYRIDME